MKQILTELFDLVQGQLCKVPDKLIYDFETPANGARVVKFSADGQRLASGCPIEGGSTSKAVVMIYSIREQTHDHH